MHSEAAFLTGYAFSLTLFAIGLEWLGRRSTDPWASRTLAACRPPTRQPSSRQASDGETDWPHSEVPAFHRGLAAVALVAALLIATLSAVRHIGPTELAIHAALLAIIGIRIRHVIGDDRIPTRPLHRPPTDAPAGD